VPEISRFFGIVVSMYFDDHSPPHLHASYGADRVRIAIETMEVLSGALPPRALALLVEWMAMHRTELDQDWARARSGRPLVRIEPLR
jgi:hypothetical protein